MTFYPFRPDSLLLLYLQTISNALYFRFCLQGVKTLSESLEHIKRAEAELRAIRMEEIHQASVPSSSSSSSSSSVEATMSTSGSVSTLEKIETPRNIEAATSVPKKNKVEPEPEPRPAVEILPDIPEGVMHVRATPPQPPPSTIGQHTSSAEVGISAGKAGRMPPNRKASSMRARRSSAANSPHN